jgi:hypothetical protein
MTRIAFVMLLAGLAGCTGGPERASFGSFATASPASEKKIVDNTVTKLATLYPPAVTRFNLQQAPADSFGRVLIATLRARGYALEEYTAASTLTAGAKDSSRTLAYVFDQPSGTDLYRVTLTIGGQSLSRVYLAKDGSVAPAGYWVRKE